jgi:hypothetical protein
MYLGTETGKKRDKEGKRNLVRENKGKKVDMVFSISIGNIRPIYTYIRLTL